MRKRIFISILALVLLTPVAWYFDLFHADWSYILGFSDASAAPVTKPIDISKKGNKVDFLVRIEENGWKTFVALYYPRNIQSNLYDNAYDELVEKYLLDDRFKRVYHPFSLKFKLMAIKNDADRTILDGVIKLGEEAKFRTTRTIFMGKLMAGAYRVIVETIDDKPELENFNALIWVNYDSAK